MDGNQGTAHDCGAALYCECLRRLPPGRQGLSQDEVLRHDCPLRLHNAPVLSLAVGHAVSTGHCVIWMTQAGPCMPPHLA